MKLQVKVRRRGAVTELREAIKNSNDEAQKTRIRAIIKLKQGSTKTEVAREFVVTPRTIRDWIHSYNKGGIPALKRSAGGRPKGTHKWNVDVFNKLIKEIDKGGKCWSVPLMQEWICKNQKVDVPKSTIWYRISNMKYSYKSSRPHPYKGDRKKQNAFKKGV